MFTSVFVMVKCVWKHYAQGRLWHVFCLHLKNSNAHFRDPILHWCILTQLLSLQRGGPIYECKYIKEYSNATTWLDITTPCDVEIWWMTPKKIEHLFYITSSFVHHFKSISEFKLELQSGKVQFGSKSTIFLAVWPCNSIYGLKKQ